MCPPLLEATLCRVQNNSLTNSLGDFEDRRLIIHALYRCSRTRCELCSKLIDANDALASSLFHLAISFSLAPSCSVCMKFASDDA